MSPPISPTTPADVEFYAGRRAFAIIYIPDYVAFTGGKDAGGPWDHPLHPILATE